MGEGRPRPRHGVCLPTLDCMWLCAACGCARRAAVRGMWLCAACGCAWRAPVQLCVRGGVRAHCWRAHAAASCMRGVWWPVLPGLIRSAWVAWRTLSAHDELAQLEVVARKVLH